MFPLIKSQNKFEHTYPIAIQAVVFVFEKLSTLNTLSES